MKDLISVIIPNYNKSKWIGDCLNSVINQTYKNIEIIFIDDGSTDNSLKVAKSFKDNRITIIQNEYNSGVSYSRNVGIKNAKGEYVTTLDSDDIYINNKKIETEYNELKNNNFKGIVFSNVSQINEKGEVVLVEGNNNNIKEGNIFKQLIECGWTTPSVFSPRDYLCKKQYLIDVGLFDEEINLYEDWDLKLKLSKRHKFKYSGNDGIGYRRLPGGLSYQSLEKHNKNIELIKKRNK
jgi:glycosyltransferase involved in cell wall biosynthesis